MKHGIYEELYQFLFKRNGLAYTYHAIILVIVVVHYSQVS